MNSDKSKFAQNSILGSNNMQADDVFSLNKCEHIKILYTNIRSLFNKNKRDEIECEVKLNNYSVVGLTETWANENISDEEMNIPGFRLYRKDRQVSTKITGVGLRCI